MGMAEVAAALSGRRGKVVEEGFVVLLDVTNLPSMTRELNSVREKMASLKKKEDRLKAAILSHGDAKIGYSDAWMKINSHTDLDVDDSVLVAKLKEKGYWDRVTTTKIAVPKLREVMEEDEEISELVKEHKSRRLKKR